MVLYKSVPLSKQNLIGYIYIRHNVLPMEHNNWLLF